VQARVVEADGFKPNSDDAEFPVKGFEKLIIPVEKAFNVFAINPMLQKHNAASLGNS
jgi:hypothetical protein